MPVFTERIPNGFFISTNSRKKETGMKQTHQHPFYEMYCLTKGSSKFFIDNEVINISEGNIVIVKKGLIHKTVYVAGAYSTRLLMCFTDEFLGGDFSDMLSEMGEQKLFVIPPVEKFEIEKLLEKIHTESEKKNVYHIQMCSQLLGELLILLYREKKNKQKRLLSENEMIMQNAAKYISENFADDLSLSMLSAKFAMSQSHFSKTFKTITGFGVNEYITLVRISNAEILLRTTCNSITDISTLCGFNDSNYFASVFKRKNGITPHKYSVICKKNKNE